MNVPVGVNGVIYPLYKPGRVTWNTRYSVNGNSLIGHIRYNCLQGRDPVFFFFFRKFQISAQSITHGIMYGIWVAYLPAGTLHS